MENYSDEEKQILIRATKENGCLEQALMTQEEAGELIQAINKLRRMKGIDFGNIHKPNGQSTVKYALVYNQLCGEVADMEIILLQMRSMLNSDQIDIIKSRKILRLQKRLNDKHGK